MRHLTITLLLITTIIGITSGKNPDPKLIHRLNRQLTEAIVSDGFSPPAAARIYAYCNVAAYEAMASVQEDMISMGGQLNGLPVRDWKVEEIVDMELLIVLVHTSIGKQLVYRGHILDHFKQNYISSRTDVSASVLAATMLEAEQCTERIKDWISTDNYSTVKESERYTAFQGPQFWEPTPPAYMDALEPNWFKLRPFFLKSADEVPIPSHDSFDTLRSSKFYSEALKVYEAVNKLNAEQLEIAKFWDCNPLQTHIMGHFNFVSRQLTPGGHWIGIAEIVTEQKDFSLKQSVEACMLLSIAMSDGFIAAWYTKYKTSLIRPETYINRYIDPQWKPILETPPFPEYPSAHSVISGAAAEVLTHFLGASVRFTDSTEVPFGLPSRVFDSFDEAADEAAISRLYGGIHYMSAIVNGKTQGHSLGKIAIDRIKTRR